MPLTCLLGALAYSLPTRPAGIAPPGAAADGPVALDLPVACPHCNSRRTRLTSAFGATACKALHMCDACRQPFESFKAI